MFIAFEGVEGSGKSTQLERLRAELERLGRPTVVAREPGGTAVGERIRRLLLDPDVRPLDPHAEALLFAAARAQLVTDVIRPALQRGQDVLCDRYVHSSLAYQGVARALGEEGIVAVNRWATGGLWPDLVVLLQLDPKLGLDRVDRADRFENEDLEFHEAVGRAYQQLAARDPERFLVVDASGSASDVAASVLAAVLSRLGSA